jgi:hypothetical protein
MTPVEVFFEHLRYEFPDEQLIRYGSPYFDIRTAGLDLIKFFRSDVKKISDHTAIFDPRQLLSANESFPEAALSDPLADLEVWDDWRTGLRAFPYPGTYSKLGITQQESKTSASSSVGVLGEIMAGIYAQAGIAPWVLVRVIRHWPDFIFALHKNRYAFVEAKAFNSNGGTNSAYGIPHGLLAEFLVTSLQQLNADPYVQVWGAFTEVQQITPLTLHVVFVETDTNDARRKALSTRVLPDVVVNGLAERALNTSLHRIDEDYIKFLTEGKARLSGSERRDLEVALISAAMQEVENMLVDQELKVVMLQSRETIEHQLAKLVKKVRPKDGFKTRRLFGAIGAGAPEGLARVRSIGAGAIFASKLSTREYVNVTTEWTQDWEMANQAWATVEHTPIWRCGGALLAISDDNLDGRPVHRNS